MRYRKSVNPRKSKGMFKRSVKPVIHNKAKPGLKRGGIRL